MISVPRLLRTGPASRADVLPLLQLLPCATAHLLPLLLLPPERVRALEPQSPSPSSSDDPVSEFLAEVVVRARPPTAAEGSGCAVAWAARTERARPCGRRAPAAGLLGLHHRRVQGVRAGVRGRAPLRCAGAAHAGRPLCAPPRAVPVG